MKNWKIAKDICCLFLGSIFYTLSVLCFTAKNEILPGGATGLATILNHLFSAPIGLCVLLINVPLFVLGARTLGKAYTVKSALATILVSLLLDILDPYLPTFSKDPLLAAIFGGVLSGLGLSLVFMRGASTGGSDLAAGIINAKYPQLSVGKIIFALDFFVCALSLPVYRSVQSFLYSVIVFFITAAVVDKVLYGTERGKLCFIITKKADRVAEEILTLGRGATMLSGTGAYTGQDMRVLLCAIREREFYSLLSAVKRADNECFVAVCEASSVKGEGFLPL